MDEKRYSADELFVENGWTVTPAGDEHPEGWLAICNEYGRPLLFVSPAKLTKAEWRASLPKILEEGVAGAWMASLLQASPDKPS